jgi:hypothetical protein
MNTDETNSDWTSFLVTFLYTLPANPYTPSMHNPRWPAATRVVMLESPLKQVMTYKQHFRMSVL